MNHQKVEETCITYLYYIKSFPIYFPNLPYVFFYRLCFYYTRFAFIIALHILVSLFTTVINLVNQPGKLLSTAQQNWLISSQTTGLPATLQCLGYWFFSALPRDSRILKLLYAEQLLLSLSYSPLSERDKSLYCK